MGENGGNSTTSPSAAAAAGNNGTSKSSNNTEQTSTTRFADYFVICGLDLETGLEPDRFAGKFKFYVLLSFGNRVQC